MKITFLPQNKTVEIESNETILQAAAKAGLDIDGNCGGKGTCGKCKVKIIKEETSVYELACQIKATEDMTVEIPNTGFAAQRKKNLIHLPKNFQMEPQKDARYGAAIDMGTTTVVVMLWNLQTGELIDAEAVSNPQGAYGADVISRISFSLEAGYNLNILRRMMTNCVNRTLKAMAVKHGIETEEIDQYVAVGNTTMTHILLGYDLEELATAPFSLAYKTGVNRLAADLGLAGSAQAEVYVAANIAGHVGADITAGLLTTDILDCDARHLFIDVGTNGEIVLAGKGRIAACSTAAGPAFEGSSISQGMRAAKGAIEKIRILTDEVQIDVIGDIEPTGICGSGIIDAVSELLKAGILDETGRLLSKSELKAKGIDEALVRHVIEEDGVNHFILHFGHHGADDILLTQKDVREVQLAKAAISAGVSMLMDEIGICTEELDKISIAGAFGSYIQKSSALQIGLLPKVDQEKIVAVGNAAGAGASMLLLCPSLRQKADELIERIEHVELAGKVGFQEKYLSAMSLSSR